jgi:hypothetical protein
MGSVFGHSIYEFFSERRLFFLVLEEDGLVSVRVACEETR